MNASVGEEPQGFKQITVRLALPLGWIPVPEVGIWAFAGSSLSLASPSSGPFAETQPIYLLAQDHLIYKPAAHKGMALFHKYTETVRDREEERMRMLS